MRPKTALAAPYIMRTIGQIAPKDDPLFRAFLDGQLLIAAQTTSPFANVLYGSAALDLGLEAAALPELKASHYPVIQTEKRPLGEGNSVFVSMSESDDDSRAPVGMRTATLSTHTTVGDGRWVSTNFAIQYAGSMYWHS